jgi:tight adherence protein B
MTAAATGAACLAALGVALSWPADLRRRSLPGPVLCAVGLGAVLLVAPHPSAATLVLVVVGIVVALDLGRWLRGRRRRSEVARRRAAVLLCCDLMAADLRAGVPPSAAIRAAAGHWEELAPVAPAAGYGADVPASFRALAGLLPGAGSLRVVAAAWQVAERSGAGLAPALDLASATLRDEEAVETTITTELASAKATAALLAVLPVGVLALGSGIGAHPWRFLLGTTPGLACLIAGLGLTRLGLLWIDRIGRESVR